MKSILFNGVVEHPNILAFVIIVVYFLFTFRNMQLRRTIPGFCTGIGVLFTFIVLVLKLSKLESKNATGIILDEKFIEDISGAFTTSIIGIACSLISVLIVKYLEDKEFKSKIEIQPYLKRHPKELLNRIDVSVVGLRDTFISKNDEILKSMNSNNEKMVEETSTIGIFLGDLNKNQIVTNDLLKEYLEKQNNIFETHFANNLKETFGTLEVKLGELLTKLGEETLGKTSTKINEHSDEVFGKLSTIYQEKVNEINFIQAENRIAIQKQNEDFNNALGTQSENWKVVLENQEKSVAKIVNAYSAILNERLDSLENTFNSLESAQKRTQSIMDTSTNQFKESVDQYKSSNNSNEGIIERINEQIEQTKIQQVLNQEILNKWENTSLKIEELTNRVADLHNSKEETTYSSPTLNL